MSNFALNETVINKNYNGRLNMRPMKNINIITKSKRDRRLTILEILAQTNFLCKKSSNFLTVRKACK